MLYCSAVRSFIYMYGAPYSPLYLIVGLWNLQAGQMESGKVVLVTAAAGGTGQFAVQVYI